MDDQPTSNTPRTDALMPCLSHPAMELARQLESELIAATESLPPTPLTDAEWFGEQIDANGGPSENWRSVAFEMRDFARSLERHAATLKAERDEARNTVEALRSEFSRVKQIAYKARSTYEQKGHRCDSRAAVDSIHDIASHYSGFDELPSLATLKARVEELEGVLGEAMAIISEHIPAHWYSINFEKLTDGEPTITEPCDCKACRLKRKAAAIDKARAASEA